MDIKLIDAQGKAQGAVAGADSVFGREYNEALVHQVVIAFQANARGGNRKQKDRSEVRHSTKKPWAQKGTGRARAGMTSSPIWRGGGRVFPNSPEENFSHKVNRKMYRAGVASILSQLVRDGRLSVCDSINVDTPKTKAFSAQLKSIGYENVLIVVDDINENLFLASRNLGHVGVVMPHQVNPLALLAFKHVLVTKAALAQIEEALK
jgi:large subunit ribosomal protein L4